MRTPTLTAARHQRLTAALWWLVAYLVILYVLFRFGHHVPGPTPASSIAD